MWNSRGQILRLSPSPKIPFKQDNVLVYNELRQCIGSIREHCKIEPDLSGFPPKAVFGPAFTPG